MSDESSGESRVPQLPDIIGLDAEGHREINSLHDLISQLRQEAGATADEDVVSVSSLVGSMRITARTHHFMEEPEEPKRDARRWQLRRKPEASASRIMQEYWLTLPPDATTPPRILFLDTSKPTLKGVKEVIQRHPYPNGLESVVTVPHSLNGTELRKAVDQATAILADPMTIMLGEDALLASDQLASTDVIQGEEARDLYKIIAPIFTEVDPDPRLLTDVNKLTKFNVVDKEPAPLGFEIDNVYVIQSAALPSSPYNTVNTSIIFAENPFAEGYPHEETGHFSVNVNATYGDGYEPTDIEIRYWQDLPKNKSRIRETTPLPLKPGERILVTEAIRRQILPANLKKIPPEER